MSKEANLTLRYTIEVRDKNGKIVTKIDRESRSLLRHFALMLNTLFYNGCQGASAVVKDTDGVPLNYPYLRTINGDMMTITAEMMDDTHGILCGKGVTAISRDDYKLADKIIHGGGTGQLLYLICAVMNVNGTPPASQFNVVRTFITSSETPVTINEIGIAVRHDHVQKGGWVYILIARDLLGAPVQVYKGQTLTVTYTFQVVA